MKKHIREWLENTAVVFKRRADSLAVTTKLALSKLGSHLNKLSGYEEIEALKEQVTIQGISTNLTRITRSVDRIIYD